MTPAIVVGSVVRTARAASRSRLIAASVVSSRSPQRGDRQHNDILAPRLATTQ
jgi:hypothetical protein